MYTLNEYLPTFVGDDLPEKGWDTGMYCLETDAVKVLRSNLQRVEEIFIGFIRLLPRYFVEHHDIPFYADQLHISTVYLSLV